MFVIDQFRIWMAKLSIVSLSDPFGDGLFKLFIGHASAGCNDDLAETFFVGSGKGFHVTFEMAARRYCSTTSSERL